MQSYQSSYFSRMSVNPLLGPRSKSITLSSQSEMFEIVGYLSAPGRIMSIEAEVPADGRDKVFEGMFPGQIYRPIMLGDTPSGMPNKMSPQFRLNLSNTRNCPKALKLAIGAGNGSCAGRINRSKFVMDLVQNYGFRFGARQNTELARSIAEQKGCLLDFERGYSR